MTVSRLFIHEHASINGDQSFIFIFIGNRLEAIYKNKGITILDFLDPKNKKRLKLG